MGAELNKTPNANRIHIGFFGRRNAGKSSVVNAVTGQEISIVSDVKGTTTDPVTKAMELLPLGPVLIIDTPGIDDIGEVGELRVKRARRMLCKTDVAVLIVDSTVGKTEDDEELLRLFREKELPHITVYNKSDIKNIRHLSENEISVSAQSGDGVEELKNKIAALAAENTAEKRIIGDMIDKNDVIVLVTPIDSSAPKGRMILPQVQTIRDILDSHAVCLVTQTDELENVLNALKEPPRLVVTDSQVFGKIKDIVPESVMLTSFSILFSKYKGFLEGAVRGAAKLDSLCDCDKILICEGCTHHRQCEDIGTVKLPSWIRAHSGAAATFEFTSGGEFPEDISGYSLIIHCGACMLNEKEMRFRARAAADAGVPFTNYGTAIAHMNGILKRSLKIFPELYGTL